MKQRILSIVGLTVMLASLFVIFNYSLAASQTPIDAGNGGGGGEPGDTGTVTDDQPEPVKPDLAVKYLLDRYQNRDNIRIDNVNNYGVVINRPLTIEAIIANLGQGTSGKTTANIYIDNVLKKTVTVRGILGGGHGSGTIDPFYTWTPTKPNHSLKIVLDPNNEIAESDETNNSYQVDFSTVSNESQLARFLDLQLYEGFNPNPNYFVHVKSIDPGDSTGTPGSAIFEVSPQGSTDVVATLGPITVGSGMQFMNQYGFGIELRYATSGYNGDVTTSIPVIGFYWATIGDAGNDQQVLSIGDSLNLTDGKTLKITAISACTSDCNFPTNFSQVQFDILDGAGSTVYSSDTLYPGSQTYYYDRYHFAVRIANIFYPQGSTDPQVGLMLQTTTTDHDFAILADTMYPFRLTDTSAEIVWTSNKPSSYQVFYRPSGSFGAYTSLPKTTWYQTLHKFILEQLQPGTKYDYSVVATDEVTQAQVKSVVYSFTTTGTKIAPVVPSKPRVIDTPTVPVPVVSLKDSSDEKSLRERIKRLQIPVTQIETDVVTQEKSLTRSTDTQLTNRLKGKILLQVENKGEAWYVDPITSEKFYLKDGDSAYQALRAFGLGISTIDLNKIPIAPVTDATISGTDTDQDGLSDSQEAALGTDLNNIDSDGDTYSDGMEVSNGFDPLGANKVSTDTKLVDRLKGRIVLQADAHGEAWYINPADGKRYFLGSGEQAYKLMRNLSLGVKNDDLRKITVGDLSSGQ